MDSYIKWMDENPKWLKVVLAIPFLDITWFVYRIIKAVKVNDNGALLISILLLIFTSWNVMAIVDIVTLILSDKIFTFIGVADKTKELLEEQEKVTKEKEEAAKKEEKVEETTEEKKED